ncbi:uncharacterized protein TRAVEDRAFT_127403 [Trametes versicolor FP-101664 SS1]|uniref:uncharacterized protein n=1 Tax=Trametes versicolor (strain FP-101664) TaxID=717944 RepID=UPI00046232D2|nr:uncharacterized protein TRAVEDRAFT_127403 [Trametes versicolor FP-101664 SS1]EIW56925.1 hypothetical protein TRAVEDRAFT_127403 [Trametes versicolor FP-101664 SS1]
MRSAQSVLRKRDEEFWYCDGSIILVAGDVEFRIYKGLLADHSPVFKDMFSLPQPPVAASPTRTNDPCPVVHLSDSPDDLRHVLRAYMPKGDPRYRSVPLYSYDEISAAIRLGHKYQMSKLLDHALDYLKRHYTNDYTTWYDHADYVPLGFKHQFYAIGVVNLARLTGETSILPTALLACCMLGKNLAHGFERVDGSREHLSLDDIGLCIAGKDKLIRESIRVAFRVFRPTVSDRCKTPGCLEAFRKMATGAEQFVDHISDPEPCGVFYSTIADTGLCRHCQAMVKERDNSERRAVWAKLPEIFGVTLPPEAPRVGVQAGGNAGAPAS